MRNLLRDFRYAARLLRQVPASRRRRPDAGARHRRQHRDLHARRRDVAAPRSRARAARTGRLVVDQFVPALPGLRGAHRYLPGARRRSAARSRVNVSTDGAPSSRSATFVTGNTFDVLGVRRRSRPSRMQPADDVFNGRSWRCSATATGRRGSAPIRRWLDAPSASTPAPRRSSASPSRASAAPRWRQSIDVFSHRRLEPASTRVLRACERDDHAGLRLADARSDACSQSVTAAQAAPDDGRHLRARCSPPHRGQIASGSGSIRSRRARSAAARPTCAPSCCCSAPSWPSRCSSAAPTSPTCCSPSRRRARVKWAFASRSARRVARVLQHALVESVLLALLGGVAAIAVAQACSDSFAPTSFPAGLPIGRMALDLDGRALAVTAALSLADRPAVRRRAGVARVAHRRPRLAARPVAQRQRHAACRATRCSRSRSPSASCSCAAPACSRAPWCRRSTPSPGFDPRGVVTASVNLGLARYEPGAAPAFYAMRSSGSKAFPASRAPRGPTCCPPAACFGVPRNRGLHPRPR